MSIFKGNYFKGRRVARDFFAGFVSKLGIESKNAKKVKRYQWSIKILNLEVEKNKLKYSYKMAD